MFYPFHIGDVSERQGEGCRPHGAAVAEGATASELRTCRLEHITEPRRGQLPQHLHHT